MARLPKPEPMKRVMIACLKRDSDTVVAALHRIGTVEISEPRALGAGTLERSRARARADVLASLLLKFRAYLSTLPKTGTVEKGHALDYEAMLKMADGVSSELDAELAAYYAKVQEIDERIQRVSSRERDVSSKADEVASQVSSLLGSSEEKRATLRQKIETLARQFEAQRSVDRMVQVEKLEGEKKALAGRELGALSEKWHGTIAAMEEMLRIAHEEAEAFVRFGETKSAIAIEGWVPETDYQKLSDLMSNLGAPVVLAPVAGTTGAPTKLSNPEIARPFENLVKLIGVPAYSGFDPTIFFAITFPLFYGLMLGDMGYGLLIFAGAFFLRRNSKGVMKDLLTVMMLASVSGMLFGAVFGEFFGSLGHEKFGLQPIWKDRLEEVQILIPVTIIIGILQVNLGLILGFLDAARHDIRHAILGKLSWIIFQLGIYAAVLSKLSILPAGLTLAGALVAVAGFVMLLAGEGFKGVLEIIGLVSNILSYTRLLAIGLASAGMALAVNKLADQAAAAGPIGFVIAIIVAIVGHGINLALGIIGPFIHSARLHYVEFFGKFFEGTGRLYNPFSIKREITAPTEPES